jgi:hypothetical protein
MQPAGPGPTPPPSLPADPGPTSPPSLPADPGPAPPPSQPATPARALAAGRPWPDPASHAAGRAWRNRAVVASSTTPVYARAPHRPTGVRLLVHLPSTASRWSQALLRWPCAGCLLSHACTVTAALSRDAALLFSAGISGKLFTVSPDCPARCAISVFFSCARHDRQVQKKSSLTVRKRLDLVCSRSSRAQTLAL